MPDAAERLDRFGVAFDLDRAALDRVGEPAGAEGHGKHGAGVGYQGHTGRWVGSGGDLGGALGDGQREGIAGDRPVQARGGRSVMDDGDREQWLDRALFPYEQQRIEVDGRELAYVDEGQGPPLLMLHGSPTWSFLYRDAIAGLRERFRCIAPDLPGFGFSTPAAGYGFRPPSTRASSNSSSRRSTSAR